MREFWLSDKSYISGDNIVVKPGDTIHVREVSQEYDDAVKAMVEALGIYADTDNWRDVWEDANRESEYFKYFYRLGNSTKDQEKIKEPHHYCMGKSAREALAQWEKVKGTKIDERPKGINAAFPCNKCDEIDLVGFPPHECKGE